MKSLWLVGWNFEVSPISKDIISKMLHNFFRIEGVIPGMIHLSIFAGLPSFTWGNVILKVSGRFILTCLLVKYT